MRSRVAALGFFGLGAGLGVNVVGFGVKVVGLGWVVVELAGLTAGLGAGLTAGLGAGLTAGLAVGAVAGELVGLGEVSDSDAMALDELPLITPKIPPATSAMANMATTGMNKRGSFTCGVYVMKHPKTVFSMSAIDRSCENSGMYRRTVHWKAAKGSPWIG